MTLHVLVTQEKDQAGKTWWIAQCLQYDIVAQAKKLSDLRHEFMRTIVGRIAICAEKNIDPFKGLPEAPEECWKMFEEASETLEKKEIPIRLPDSLPSSFVLPKSEMRMAC
jgi:hypothetical protein